MTRDEYIEANWRRFAGPRRQPPGGNWPEPLARRQAGEDWDANHSPRRLLIRWDLRRARFGRPHWTAESVRVGLLFAVALELDEQLPATRTG